MRTSAIVLGVVAALLQLTMAQEDRGAQRDGSKHNMDINWTTPLSIFICRGLLPVLHRPVPQPAMHGSQLHLHLWNLLHQLRVLLKGRHCWWQLCCWVWSVLCDYQHHLWNIHLHQHHLHQEPGIPQQLHSLLSLHLYLHLQQSLGRYLSTEAGLPDILWVCHVNNCWTVRWHPGNERTDWSGPPGYLWH